jgi:protein-S-isoprenylcysteine O-methyltransferase Ste14
MNSPKLKRLMTLTSLVGHLVLIALGGFLLWACWSLQFPPFSESVTYPDGLMTGGLFAGEEIQARIRHFMYVIAVPEALLVVWFLVRLQRFSKRGH